MSESRSSSSTFAMGITGWLTLLFVLLKLNPGGHLDSIVIDWSWWAVFSPILIVWGIVFVILISTLLVFLVDFGMKEHKIRKRRKNKNIQFMTPEERRAHFARKRKP